MPGASRDARTHVSWNHAPTRDRRAGSDYVSRWEITGSNCMSNGKVAWAATTWDIRSLLDHQDCVRRAGGKWEVCLVLGDDSEVVVVRAGEAEAVRGVEASAGSVADHVELEPRGSGRPCLEHELLAGGRDRPPAQPAAEVDVPVHPRNVGSDPERDRGSHAQRERAGGHGQRVLEVATVGEAQRA